MASCVKTRVVNYFARYAITLECAFKSLWPVNDDICSSSTIHKQPSIRLLRIGKAVQLATWPVLSKRGAKMLSVLATASWSPTLTSLARLLFNHCNDNIGTERRYLASFLTNGLFNEKVFSTHAPIMRRLIFSSFPTATRLVLVTTYKALGLYASTFDVSECCRQKRCHNRCCCVCEGKKEQKGVRAVS